MRVERPLLHPDSNDGWSSPMPLCIGSAFYYRDKHVFEIRLPSLELADHERVICE
jgi:hypothetical protein